MSRRDALEAEWAVLRAWIGDVLDDPDATGLLATPSVLDGWTVADLVAHVAQGLRPLTGAQPAPRGTRPQGVAEYVGGYAESATGIAGASRTLASGRTAADLAAMLDERWAEALAAAEALGEDERRVVVVKRGPVRLGDLLVTRLFELVVHGDDLARSLPDRTPPAHPRAALRTVVKALLDVLAERFPGGALEVRVPPFAAVQCLEGGSHTRGTPPNVVETDPLTWVRLAAGRLPWAAAVSSGQVLASGRRADLAPHIPLL